MVTDADILNSETTAIDIGIASLSRESQVVGLIHYVSDFSASGV
jgi:hypothetical protein